MVLRATDPSPRQSRAAATISVREVNELGIRTVIVPLDASADASRALPMARFLARSLGVEVHLLAVAASPAAGRRLEPVLERAHAVLAEHLGDTRVAYDFSTADRIVAAARPNHAVACLATGWSPGRSIARQVVFASDGPVVLVGPSSRVELGEEPELVTALAGTARDAELARAAGRWAHGLGLRHTVLARAGTTIDPNVVDLTGRPVVVDHGLVEGFFRYTAERPVTLASWVVATGWFRRLGRSGRVAARVVRGAPCPILAFGVR